MQKTLSIKVLRGNKFETGRRLIDGVEYALTAGTRNLIGGRTSVTISDSPLKNAIKLEYFNDGYGFIRYKTQEQKENPRIGNWCSVCDRAFTLHTGFVVLPEFLWVKLGRKSRSKRIN